MLRFDVALEALKRQMTSKQNRRGKAPATEPQPGAILIPFPLRRLPAAESVSVAPVKRRVPG